MKYHSDTREWEYDSEGKKIIWKSFFPEYPFEHSEYGIAFFILHIMLRKITISKSVQKIEQLSVGSLLYLIFKKQMKV